MLNTRDPSAQSQSRQERSHKSKTKTSIVQRKSEEIVVLAIIATKNAMGGKDLCGGHVGEAGKREGMAA
jgi:hypothetical protein